MATSKSKGGPDIKFDEFIKHVKPDPAGTDQVVLMTGYVGASDKNDSIRLYSDASLAEYVDIQRTDILYSIANTGDPLGGSQLWVKATAEVTYSDPQAFTQGNMYTDYMQNTFDPGFASHDSPAITKICPAPVLTKAALCNQPSKFICPTPASKLVVCTIKTVATCPVVTVTKTITTQPSLVDGCPSQWVCPTNTWQTGGTTVINPGQQFAGNYAAGDMYGDYMQNTYQPAADPSGAPAITTPQLCLQPATNTAACYQLATHVAVCFKSIQRNFCPVPVTVNQVHCLTQNKVRTICSPCYQTTHTTITITPTTVQTGTSVIFPGQQFAPDYTGGDMYGDYIQNTYQPAADPSGTPATSPQLCLQPVTNTPGCYVMATQNVVCKTNLCPVTINPAQCITRNKVRSICSPCQQTTYNTITITPTTVQTILTGGTSVIFPGQQFAPDYTGGDMYGDYMQNTYQPAAADPSNAPAPTTPQVCLQLNTVNAVCATRQIACRPSVFVICITRNNVLSLCRPCYHTTHTTITITPTTVQTGTIQTGTVVGGQFADPYGYY